MALETEIRLACDSCDARSDWFDGAIFTHKMLFDELRLIGWVRRRGGRTTTEGTECPRCSGKGAKVQ